MTLLEVCNITKRFGGLIALKNVSLKVEEGELVGLIGPNGSGKTTLFNCISQIYKVDEGSIKFMGKEITGMPAHEVTRLGIARTFQLVRIFPQLTGLENVMIGLLYGRKDMSRSEAAKEAEQYLEYVGLRRKAYELAKNYTLVEMKFLELARALATNPKLLLLDELVAGLNPTERLWAMELLKRIHNDLKITIIWVEHVMPAIMALANRLIVLNQGVKIAEGPPEVVANDKEVIAAYLGEPSLSKG